MVSAQPDALLNVLAPAMVVWLICSNDVQFDLLRSLQLPLESQAMPAARSCAVACACVYFAGAADATDAPMTRAANIATTAAIVRTNMRSLSLRPRCRDARKER